MGCQQYGLNFMPITRKTDLKGVVSLPNYVPSSLVVTRGIENFTYYRLAIYSLYHGLTNRVNDYYDQLGGYQPNFLPDQVSKICKISQKRQDDDKSGIYCLNIYYHTYCPRDCQMSRRDFCSCKQGGGFHTHSRWPLLRQQYSSSSKFSCAQCFHQESPSLRFKTSCTSLLGEDELCC